MFAGGEVVRVVLCGDEINVFGRREIVYEVETPDTPVVAVPKKRSRQIKLFIYNKRRVKKK